MKQFFHPDAINPRKFVSSDNLNLCQQIGSLVLSVSNTRLNSAAGYPYLVDDIAVLGNVGVIREGSQNINCAAFNIISLKFATDRKLPAFR